MRFATRRQIVAMTLAWAAFLFGLHSLLLPRAAEGPAGLPAGGARIRLFVNHLCCSGCGSDLTAAIQSAVTGKVRVQQVDLPSSSEADRNPQDKSDYGNWFAVDVDDIRTVDFARLDRAVRDSGLVAGQMVLLFPEPIHLRLEASVRHMCCEQCVIGAQAELHRLRSLGVPTGRLGWLDSLRVEKVKRRITGYARILQPGEGLDVQEFMEAMDDAGFHPESVRVQIGQEAPGA